MFYSNNTEAAVAACERERTGCYGDESDMPVEDYPANEFYARYIMEMRYSGRKEF